MFCSYTNSRGKSPHMLNNNRTTVNLCWLVYTTARLSTADSAAPPKCLKNCLPLSKKPNAWPLNSIPARVENLLIIRTWHKVVTLNYKVLNTKYIRQTYENSRFNSLVWSSLTLTPTNGPGNFRHKNHYQDLLCIFHPTVCGTYLYIS